MKIFFLTGMYPTPTTPHGGVFITKRLKYLKSKVELDLHVLAVKDTVLLKLVKKFLGKTPNPNNDLKETIYLNEISMSYRVIFVNEGILDKVLNKITKYSYMLKKSEKQILKYANKNKYDLFHSHWAYPHGVVLDKVANKVNTPSIITPHGSDINVLLDIPSLKEKIITSLNNVDLVEFVSNSQYENAKINGFRNDYEIVPNGIEKIEFNKDRAISNTNDKKIVGFVGNLIHIKGADLLEEIINGIEKSLPNKVSFKIIGDGIYKKKLEEKINRKNIEFTGRIPHEEVLKEMRNMDVLLLPSRNEGWPCVVLEAHSNELVVIGSDRGGIPEAINNQELVVNMNDQFVNEYISKVVSFLNGDIYVDKSSLRLRAANFEWDILTDKTINNYIKIMKKNK